MLVGSKSKIWFISRVLIIAKDNLVSFYRADLGTYTAKNNNSINRKYKPFFRRIFVARAQINIYEAIVKGLNQGFIS